MKLLAWISVEVTVVILAGILAYPQAPGNLPQRRTPGVFEELPASNVPPIPSNAQEKIVRQSRSRLFDRAGTCPLTELSPDIEPLPVILNALAEPALPISRSDAIVLGQVLSAQSHFSDDKSAIYTEFAIRVETIFKNSAGNSLNVGQLITVNRLGGALRLPTGRLLRLRVDSHGTPLPARRYVFFLNSHGEGQVFGTIKVYELHDGSVFLLDQHVRSADGKIPYWGVDETTFLNDLRHATAVAPFRKSPESRT